MILVERRPLAHARRRWHREREVGRQTLIAVIQDGPYRVPAKTVRKNRIFGFFRRFGPLLAADLFELAVFRHVRSPVEGTAGIRTGSVHHRPLSGGGPFLQSVRGGWSNAGTTRCDVRSARCRRRSPSAEARRRKSAAEHVVPEAHVRRAGQASRRMLRARTRRPLRRTPSRPPSGSSHRDGENDAAFHPPIGRRAARRRSRQMSRSASAAARSRGP